MAYIHYVTVFILAQQSIQRNPTRNKEL